MRPTLTTTETTMHSPTISLQHLAAILAAARFGNRAVALRSLTAAWPDAAQRAEGIERVRAVDPDAGEILAALNAEVVS